MKLCKQWSLIGHTSEPVTNARAERTCTLAEVQETDDALQPFDARPDEAVDNYNFPPLDTNMETFGTSWEGSGFDWSGSWLLNI
jgi:hypothetical protein